MLCWWRASAASFSFLLCCDSYDTLVLDITLIELCPVERNVCKKCASNELEQSICTLKKKGEETRKRLQASNEWALALTQKLTRCFHRGICAIRSTFDGLLCAYEFRGPCMIVCCVVVWACKDCSLSERSLSISFPMCSGWHARNW